MGVLHYGGFFDVPEDSIARGLEIVSEGADIIDVGDDVPALEDVIAALASHTRVSIHTTDPIVAASALGAGASIVNDMSASLWPIAAEAGAGWIAVHGAEGTDPTDPDVVATVRDMLVERGTAALEGGVDEIWIDPGVGFGKTLRQSVRLLADSTSSSPPASPSPSPRVASGSSAHCSRRRMHGRSSHRFPGCSHRRSSTSPTTICSQTRTIASRAHSPPRCMHSCTAPHC